MRLEDYDDQIEAWHAGAGKDKQLHEFLGLTWEEYKKTGRTSILNLSRIH